jgi:hypothetical protein
MMRMRGWLFTRVEAGGKTAFSFMGMRCDRMVYGVFAQLAELGAHLQQKAMPRMALTMPS